MAMTLLGNVLLISVDFFSVISLFSLILSPIDIWSTQDSVHHISKDLKFHSSKYQIFNPLLSVWENDEILTSVAEQFSIECYKTKTNVITLANHKGHRQYSEPIKARSNYM